MKRRACGILTRQQMEKLLSIGGMSICSITHDHDRDVFVVYLRGGILPPVQEGEKSPEVEITVLKGALVTVQPPEKLHG